MQVQLDADDLSFHLAANPEHQVIWTDVRFKPHSFQRGFCYLRTGDLTRLHEHRMELFELRYDPEALPLMLCTEVPEKETELGARGPRSH